MSSAEVSYSASLVPESKVDRDYLNVRDRFYNIQLYCDKDISARKRIRIIFNIEQTLWGSTSDGVFPIEVSGKYVLEEIPDSLPMEFPSVEVTGDSDVYNLDGQIVTSGGGLEGFMDREDLSP